MKKIVLQGGAKLNGEISVSGSKNAALPIIFACILTNGVSEIENLPDIGDVRDALELIKIFGARIEMADGKALIDTRELSYEKPSAALASKIRASTYLIGSCLARFGRCHILPFGGCNFSLRPIDMHLDACLKLGATVDGDFITASRLVGGEIHFAKPSVGATVNAILLSASADGETHIHGCAIEPHIDALIDFLNSCGAMIERKGRSLYVVGRELHGGKISIIGDMIEAGSYLALGALTGGKIRVNNLPMSDMDSVFREFSDIGVQIDVESDSAIAGQLTSGNFLSLTTSPYPGFPTDLQPIFAPLMAAAEGGVITDTVWQSRFGYLNSLAPFGIESRLFEGSAQIYKSKTKCAKTVSTDLRGGMACLITALSSPGISEIYSADLILRGYENLENKLGVLGADINILDG